jgi:hypothetical protein
MPPPSDLDRLSHAELKDLVLQLLEKVSELQRIVAAQRDEIARLKGGSGRPNIKPSGMEQATEPPLDRAGNPRRPRGSTRSKLLIDEEQIIKLAASPSGSRFKGYTSFVVQDLVMRPHVVEFRCERWQTPDGEMITAPLPAGFHGHFGPHLRRFVLALYHQGQVTMLRLLSLLREFGILISKRQIVRLLNEDKQGFLDEARDVLRAGLSDASWISVDDTGARHKAQNGVCTQIGNDYFAWFGTTGVKNRLNFLELLRAGYTDYVINDAALAYMRRRKLAGPTIALLAAHVDKHFSDRMAWQAHLDRLALVSLEVTRDPFQVATEGAVWGSIKAHALLRDTVIVSDDAGQFAVSTHALCWVHAERLVHELDTFTEDQRSAQKRVRDQIWEFYRDLKIYRRDPSAQHKAKLGARFDEIFQQQTGSVMLDRLLKRLHANRAELLLVLDRPEIPLHTNGSENDIRCHVTRRKISGGTRSDAGRDCRDAFLGLAKTCAKLRIAFWDYLGSRLAVPGNPMIPYLPEMIAAQLRPP